MNIKRSLFVFSLIILFSFCYIIMNQHYDELARYPHKLTEKQRELVLEHLQTEEINTLISQKIEPNQFLPYIETEGFELVNTVWYDTAYRSQKEEQTKEFIISFINKYKSFLSYSELKDVLQNYSFNVMIRFFDEGDAYVAGAKLIANPSYQYTMVGPKETLYTYEPSDLLSLADLPHNSIVNGANDILIKREVLEPLQQLCSVASEINDKACGDMSIVTGYLSYEDQTKLFEKAQTKYEDGVAQYWDYPGQSEYQLGYSVQLLPNEVSADITNKENTTENEDSGSSEEERTQEIWLKDNAYKYGFIIRYTKQKETTTGKTYQPYTLRFVGKEMAKHMHDKNMVLEEVKLSDFK